LKSKEEKLESELIAVHRACYYKTSSNSDNKDNSNIIKVKPGYPKLYASAYIPVKTKLLGPFTDVVMSSGSKKRQA
jgi:hypothetical protein